VDALGVRRGLRVALALLRQDVEQDGAVERARALQVLDEQRDVVPVDRADVRHAELLEDVPGDDRVAHDLPDLLERAVDARADHGDRRDQALDLLVRALDEPVVADARQVPRERADRAADRPLVVVQDDEEALAAGRGVVQRLEGDPRAERRVADERDDLRRVLLVRARERQPERERDRRARVSRVEQVVVGLPRVREAAQAVRLPQRAEAIAAAGQQLVRVGLVADVEDQPIPPEVEDVVERGRDLDRPEVRAEVAARPLDRVEQEGAHLGAHRRQLGRGKALQVEGRADRREEVHAAP
jgi:hypothetical protein